MADVQAMFHQVKVTHEERDVLRYSWWSDGDSSRQPSVYRMTVHSFGGTWSPSCCTFALQRTAEDNRADFQPDAVDTVMQLKQEASDWPSWCQSDEQKHQYIQQYLDKEGIHLEWDKIKKNPGLRAIAKLMLNSFWGKFGQRPNMSKTTYVKDPTEYLDMMTRDGLEIQGVNFVNDEMVEVQWQNTGEFVESSGRTNVILAAYTTCQARLKLYEVLEKLDQRVLYYDTDSVIYVSRDGEWEPETGDFLGELTNELESDNHIVSFVSGGPKNYAYKLARPDKGGYLTHCKVRGITLNYRNQFLVNFDTVSQMVRNEGPKRVQVTDPYKISRNKKTINIETKEAKKHYQVVYTKRVPLENYDTIPYGY
ncbi:uncharacterized protein LOC119721520 [Patiria miniata]|uniref:DNA-directed DNA polymerase n=1 Tax=Patiria miniata TaxID=46514 RepID=A0A913Z9G2_PATMI|nr:uncharacterized protein LOC119721520 [Patiria miniata]